MSYCNDYTKIFEQIRLFRGDVDYRGSLEQGPRYFAQNLSTLNKILIL